MHHPAPLATDATKQRAHHFGEDTNRESSLGNIRGATPQRAVEIDRAVRGAEVLSKNRRETCMHKS